jgi:hypothetical protein
MYFARLVFIFFKTQADLTLLVEVYDWDLIGSNDYMGSVTVSMSHVTQSYNASWFTLKDDVIMFFFLKIWLNLVFLFNRKVRFVSVLIRQN